MLWSLELTIDIVVWGLQLKLVDDLNRWWVVGGRWMTSRHCSVRVMSEKNFIFLYLH